MKKIILFLLCTFFFVSSADAFVITMKDTLYLFKATHVDYQVQSWDTMFVTVEYDGSVIGDTVPLVSDADNGRWRGTWIPADQSGLVTGVYAALFHAVYSTDTTIEEQYFGLIDTAAFHGSAAGITAPQVAKATADTLLARGLFSGAGAFACTVYAKLSTDSSALAGIHVIAKNTDQTATLGNCYTNANGWCALGLDSIAGGAYHKFWLIDVDYSFTFPESADVNTDTGLTFYGSAFDYGDPPPENQCAVYGQIFDAQLDSLEGAEVKAEVHIPYSDSVLRYQGYPISRFKVADTTTVTGRWRLDLIPNSLFLPTGTYYVFSFSYPVAWGGYIIRKDTLTVPADTARSWKELKGW